MTVTDCHHEKTAVQKREHAKNFQIFGKGLQTTDIDRHSTYIKKMQKSPKNWENVGRCTSYTYFTHARKKVKISSTQKGMEMTCIDLHHFFFIAWRKEASPTRNRNIYNYCCMSIVISHKLSLLFLLVLPPFQKRPSPTVTKKVQKSQKTGKKRRQCRKGNTQKIFRFLGKVCF